VELPREIMESPMLSHLGEDKSTRPLLELWNTGLGSSLGNLNQARGALESEVRSRWRLATQDTPTPFNQVLELLPGYVSAYLARDPLEMSIFLSDWCIREIGAAKDKTTPPFDPEPLLKFFGFTSWEDFVEQAAKLKSLLAARPEKRPDPGMFPSWYDCGQLIFVAVWSYEQATPRILQPVLRFPGLGLLPFQERLLELLTWFQQEPGKSAVDSAASAEASARETARRVLAEVERLRVLPLLHSDCGWLPA
jgi:hypothetical protein